MQPYGVVIPAWNAQATIAETIRSVLGQSHPPADVVVVDDGSDDATAAIAATVSPAVRVIRQTRTGPGGACTRGIETLETPLIALLDADDLWLPQKMQRQVTMLAAHPDVALIGCRMRQFHDGQPDDGTGEERAGLLRSPLVFRRAVYADVGPIQDMPGMRGDMIDWLARCREAGHTALELDEVLALRRILPGSLSYGRDPARDRGYLAAARQAMLRRKGGGRPE